MRKCVVHGIILYKYVPYGVQYRNKWKDPQYYVSIINNSTPCLRPVYVLLALWFEIRVIYRTQLEKQDHVGRGGGGEEWTDCVADDRWVFGIMGDWSTAALYLLCASLFSHPPLVCYI